MSPLKKIKNWFIRQFTNPPKYEKLTSDEKGVSTAELLGSGGSKGLNLAMDTAFIHGSIDEKGEYQLNNFLRDHSETTNLSSFILDFGAEKRTFFTNVILDYATDTPGEIFYPICKFFTGKLSNSDELLIEAKKYLNSYPIPSDGFRRYFTIVIDDGDDPTFFVSTARDEVYTPPALKS